MTTTPNMNLTLPTVSQTAGPTYATQINSDLTTIDAHDHSSGNGVQITPLGMNINANLPFNGFKATSLLGLTFSAQGSPVSASGTLSESGVDLYYTDGNGNQIRITQSGGLAGTPGSITNLAAPATASYVAASSKFVWQSAANTAADLDARSVLLRNASASSNALTLNPPAAMASNFSLTLPIIPATESFTSVDTAGNFKSVCSVSLGITELNIKTGVQIPVTSQTKSSAYNILKSDGIIYADPSGATFDLTLYNAASASGYTVVINQTTATTNRVNINTVGGNVIIGEKVGNVSSTSINVQFETLTLLSDGANWEIINRSYPRAEAAGVVNTFTGTSSNPTKGTTVDDVIYYRREGNMMICRMQYRQTVAGSAGSGAYLVAIPGGWTIDGAYMNFDTQATAAAGLVAVANTVGNFWVVAQGSEAISGNAVAYDSTRVAIQGIFQNGDTGGFWGSGACSFGTTTMSANGTFMVPIAGWK